MTRTIKTFATCLRVGDVLLSSRDLNECTIIDICGDNHSFTATFDTLYNGSRGWTFTPIDVVELIMPKKFEEDQNPTQLMSKHDRVFDSTSRHWKKNGELNKLFLRCQLNYFNDLLHARGHVFLNEVYDALGFERTSYGALMGWITPSIGAISFGDLEKQRVVNEFVLNFNIQGTVFDTLPGDWEMP